MMKIDARFVSLLVVALVVGTTLGGCLISGTKVFSQRLPEIRATGGIFEAAGLDFTEDETFNEYQDKIRLIDRFGFSGTIQNNNATATTMSMYFSGKNNVTMQELGTETAPALFLNFPVPAAGTQITYDESQKIIQNFAALQTQVKIGQIYFYTVATGNYNLTIPDMVVTVTFTVGL